MLPTLFTAAGVILVARLVCKELSKIANPVLHDLWEAALQGNSVTVRRLIRKHRIQPDSRHHVSDASLVIKIAELRTDSEALDWGLAQVLRTLAQAGWSLTVQRRSTHESGVHILACQPKQCCTEHRMGELLTAERRRSLGRTLTGWIPIVRRIGGAEEIHEVAPESMDGC